ncbi:MAG: hypothetical protein C4521_04915 [Actinobacteria bacterium]|nr:MAG: hypothetical protein C4521_04915 [Actinomycetota bacterium]
MSREAYKGNPYTEEAPFKIHGGCGLAGVMDVSGKRFNGEDITTAMEYLHDRGNGLGGGFAAYGIFPDWPDHFALQMMYDSEAAKESAEAYLKKLFVIDHEEPIPTRITPAAGDHPILHRYFVKPDPGLLESRLISEADFMVEVVMTVNASINGAYVASSGKNMGGFKGVGFPEEMSAFYRLDEYEGHTWIGHGRFPTNTPGWWGGAHPFGLLDWSIVHNGEISSYGINSRYLEAFGYKCTLRTDTEVMAYLFDLLLRRHGLPLELACAAVASPFWADIDRMEENEREILTALRSVYGGAMANGPFAIILGHAGGMIGLNDRIKLRPLIAAADGTRRFIASEESSIRSICEAPEEVWMPKAGEPVIFELEDGVRPADAFVKAGTFTQAGVQTEAGVV